MATVEAQCLAKSDGVHVNHQIQSDIAASLHQSLPLDLQRILSLSSEKGASPWLSVLPVSEHAMNCPTGSYPTLRYNELRDFTANALSEMCSGVCVCVCVEPSLQTLSGETLTFSTAIVEDGARLDVSADGFWGGHHQRVYFDVNPTAPSYCATSVPSLYRRFEKEKRRKYEQRIREVELSSFGGMSRCTHIVYKHLAYLLSLKSGISFCNVVAWLRCSLSFSLQH